ncbi:MAG: tRNA lysidine(34) synthetase TilS, partial [Bacteroidaceae bacterium]|nr:tRNA lysidine(34) synthetase TilS [Bacteroidaceae bacterium]
MLILSTRNRREGDLIRDGGMNKKVKKLLCDKKIPVELRDHLPVVCDGDEI